MSHHDIVVAWSGVAPPPALKKRLEREGARVVRGDGDVPSNALVVTSTSRADRAPDGAPSDLPWVWLCPGTPTRAALAAAARAFVYDVVDSDKPVSDVVERLLARAKEIEAPVKAPPEAEHLVAKSDAARRLVAELAHAARTSMPVLLTGETGSGKEVLTRLLHDWSSRHAKPFVPVNCAAIPNEMLEAELFGYARGAFSGAVRGYDGQLRAAEGGSVFLDEVDDTPLSFQVKLLRVLEDKVVSRLGENTWHKVDFRILAATNRDLERLIARGLFGADLYERLAIVSIRVPPLRERREDIPGLSEQLIARFYAEEPSAKVRHVVDRVTAEALDVLVTHDWPGNIRELRNVLYAALVRKRAGRELLVSDLPARLFETPRAEATSEALVPSDRLRELIESGQFDLRTAVERLERDALAVALEKTNGNAAAAADLLGTVGRGSARAPGATVRAMKRRLGLG